MFTHLCLKREHKADTLISYTLYIRGLPTVGHFDPKLYKRFSRLAFVFSEIRNTANKMTFILYT